MKATYIGGGVFRFGDRRMVKGEILEGPPALIEALIARGDFEPAGSEPKKKTKKSKKSEAETVPIDIEEL